MDKLREENKHLISLLRKRRARLLSIQKVTEKEETEAEIQPPKEEQIDEELSKDDDAADSGKMEEEIGELIEITNGIDEEDISEIWTNKRRKLEPNESAD